PRVVVGADDVSRDREGLHVEPEVLDRDTVASREAMDDGAPPLLHGDVVDVEGDAAEARAAPERHAVSPRHQNAPTGISPRLTEPVVRVRVTVARAPPSASTRMLTSTPASRSPSSTSAAGPMRGASMISRARCALDSSACRRRCSMYA